MSLSMAPNDQALVPALRAGDKSGFCRVFLIVSADIRAERWRVAQRSRGRRCGLGRVFIKVLTNLGDFRGDTRLNVWLYRVVYKASIARFRSKKSEATAVPIDGFDNCEGMWKISGCING